MARATRSDSATSAWRRPRWCAIAYANYPHWWDVVMRCTPRKARALEWQEMARQALQHAEYAGNPWYLADPLGRVIVEMPELLETSPIIMISSSCHTL